MSGPAMKQKLRDTRSGEIYEVIAMHEKQGPFTGSMGSPVFPKSKIKAKRVSPNPSEVARVFHRRPWPPTYFEIVE